LREIYVRLSQIREIKEIKEIKEVLGKLKTGKVRGFCKIFYKIKILDFKEI